MIRRFSSTWVALAAVALGAGLAAPPALAQPVTAPPGPEPAAPGATAKARSTSERLLGGPAMGTLLYATGMAEFGLVLGSIAVGGVRGGAVGLHYAERNGALARTLAMALAGAGAQQTANAQQRTVTVYTGEFKPEHLGGFALTLDAFGSDLGGATEGFTCDVFFGWALARESRTPFLLDVGVSSAVLAVTAGGPAMAGHPPSGSLGGTIGFLLGGMAPLTRFAQLDAHSRAYVGGYALVDAGLSVNLGNRFVLRGAVELLRAGRGEASSYGTTVMVGVRL